MGKTDKRLRAWRDNTPVDAPVDQVEAIFVRYLPDGYRKKPGSHVTVHHNRLIGCEGFGPLGDFTICVNRGQRVKGFYLKLLAQAVYIIEEVRNDEHQES